MVYDTKKIIEALTGNISDMSEVQSIVIIWCNIVNELKKLGFEQL
jgi:hypothetical protein